MNVTEAVAQILVEGWTDSRYGYPSHPLLDAGTAYEDASRSIFVRQAARAPH